jgi:hypothetical protein
MEGLWIKSLEKLSQDGSIKMVILTEKKKDINHPGWEYFEWNGLKYSYSGFKLSTVYNALLRKWSKLKQQEENIQKLESLKFIKVLGIEGEEAEGDYHLQL